jgi:hypothetical protein
MSSEKAGVGGSTPSLATIIPNDLDDCEQNSSVRCQSAFRRASLAASSKYLIAKNLTRSDSSLVRSQSASVRGMAENCGKHRPCGGHAVLAHAVSVVGSGNSGTRIPGSDGCVEKSETISKREVRRRRCRFPRNHARLELGCEKVVCASKSEIQKAERRALTARCDFAHARRIEGGA